MSTNGPTVGTSNCRLYRLGHIIAPGGDSYHFQTVTEDYKSLSVETICPVLHSKYQPLQTFRLVVFLKGYHYNFM